MNSIQLTEEQRTERSARPRRKKYRARLWLFVLPAAIPYIFVVLVPSIQGTGYAFTD